MRSLKPDVEFSQDLSADELDFEAVYTKDYKLDQVYIKFSENVSETVTISVINDADGSSYTQILFEGVLVEEDALTWRPQGEANFNKNDKIRVQTTNVGGSGTLAGKVRTSEVRL